MAYYPAPYYSQNFNSQYPASYQQAPMNNQMSYAPPQQQAGPGWIWVDGEIGARAYQIPPGTAPGVTIPLWDTNDMVIYLKSLNAMGMPNPIQKLRYYPEENQQQKRISGDEKPEEKPDESKFVTKDEFEQMKREIEEILTAPSNQNNRK